MQRCYNDNFHSCTNAATQKILCRDEVCCDVSMKYSTNSNQNSSPTRAEASRNNLKSSYEVLALFIPVNFLPQLISTVQKVV